MFFKKSHKEEAAAFKDKLNSIIADSEVQKNSKLVELLQNAVKKAEKHESIQSIASNLSLNLKSNFSKTELPAPVVDL
ncbi:bacteriocin immunity protein [uncultured Lactobacillus sp.]|uniref:bacteriocin immunity protein n=1 Tax=uncultured Lactobacillus sp. TaxID=153152 RepID=UPI00261C8FD3|nr:bacteriocin immunity protein [uncultured Lactobacillus sp.]